MPWAVKPGHVHEKRRKEIEQPKGKREETSNISDRGEFDEEYDNHTA